MNIFCFSMNVKSSLSATQKILFYFLYCFLYILSLIPFGVIYILSDFLYFIAYYIIRYRRKLVRKNLKESFPQKSDNEIIEIEKNFYLWLCDYIVETIKLASISKEEMKRRVTYTNLDVLNDTLNKGYSIAFYLGHYCNWEYVTSLGLYMPENSITQQVYHPLENKVMDAIMLKLRSKMGTESVSMENILRRIGEAKRDKQQISIGFISDQVPFWNNIHYWTNFLNHDTPVLTGTERLAKKFDLACIYLDMSRRKRGYYEIDIKLLTDEPKQMKDWNITEMFFRTFEKTIQQQPEQWLWTHNRWKRTREDYNKMIDAETGRIKF